MPSENVCRAMCGAGDLCRGYLWNERSKTCIPKSGFAKTLRHDPDTITVLRSREVHPVKRYYSKRYRETRVRTLTVSGLRDGDDSTRLFRSARGRILGRRNNPGVQSEALCQNICLWNGDCVGVRYFSQSDRCEEITRLGRGRGDTAYLARR